MDTPWLRALTRRASVVLPLGWLAACASLAPTYDRPAPPVAATWPVPEQPPSAADATPAGDIAWYEFYGDAQLRQLIALALAHNRDLRAT